MSQLLIWKTIDITTFVIWQEASSRPILLFPWVGSSSRPQYTSGLPRYTWQMHNYKRDEKCQMARMSIIHLGCARCSGSRLSKCSTMQLLSQNPTSMKGIVCSSSEYANFETIIEKITFTLFDSSWYQRICLIIFPLVQPNCSCLLLVVVYVWCCVSP